MLLYDRLYSFLLKCGIELSIDFKKKKAIEKEAIFLGVKKIILCNFPNKTIPHYIELLKNLEELIIISKHPVKLNSKIGNFKKLRILSLHGVELTKIPNWIFKLSSLEELHISLTLIDSIPQQISNLTKLKYFSLFYNAPITNIHSSFFSMSNLNSYRIEITQNLLMQLIDSDIDDITLDKLHCSWNYIDCFSLNKGSLVEKIMSQFILLYILRDKQNNPKSDFVFANKQLINWTTTWSTYSIYTAIGVIYAKRLPFLEKLSKVKPYKTYKKKEGNFEVDNKIISLQNQNKEVKNLKLSKIPAQILVKFISEIRKYLKLDLKKVVVPLNILSCNVETIDNYINAKYTEDYKALKNIYDHNLDFKVDTVQDEYIEIAKKLYNLEPLEENLTYILIDKIKNRLHNDDNLWQLIFSDWDLNKTEKLGKYWKVLLCMPYEQLYCHGSMEILSSYEIDILEMDIMTFDIPYKGDSKKKITWLLENDIDFLIKKILTEPSFCLEQNFMFHKSMRQSKIYGKIFEINFIKLAILNKWGKMISPDREWEWPNDPLNFL